MSVHMTEWMLSPALAPGVIRHIIEARTHSLSFFFACPTREELS